MTDKLRTNAALGHNHLPPLVEFRCAEKYRDRPCGALVGDITPLERMGPPFGKPPQEPKGVDWVFQGVDWGELTLEVNTPQHLHRPLEWDGNNASDPAVVGKTLAEVYEGDERRIPDGEFAIFTVESRRKGPGPWMPAHVACVCGRGRHRDLVIDREDVEAAVAEWKVTRRKVTRGVTARR